ncbi:MAG TPA: NUDIX domain-containing protein [Candidatus Limnocylindrales bacterium]|nr:NUDIX domain-containing protein [Candidatus Limnocylindrales bacterium]
MVKQSAGIVLYRKKDDAVEVLLGHPGGPFFVKKDDGVWSIPKGEFAEDEDALQAAEREFSEEIGMPVPAGTRQPLGSVKLSNGKIVYAWAVQGDLDQSAIKSNNFSLEWPPKSGQKQEFPEIDRAGWFTLRDATEKLYKYQTPLIKRLATLLNLGPEDPSLAVDTIDITPTQPSLF